VLILQRSQLAKKEYGEEQQILHQAIPIAERILGADDPDVLRINMELCGKSK